MVSSPLTITVSYDGQVCVLAAKGDLDLTNAARFTRCASHALDDAPERLVFDLADLAFVDCAGAGSLIAAAQAAPEGCPVIVRSVSLRAARLLGLLGQDLEHVPASTAPHRPQAPTQDQISMGARVIHAAHEIAVTEERIAATFARLATQRPDQADKLTAVSRSAHDYAIRTRQWAHRHRALASAAPSPHRRPGLGRAAVPAKTQGPRRRAGHPLASSC